MGKLLWKKGRYYGALHCRSTEHFALFWTRQNQLLASNNEHATLGTSPIERILPVRPTECLMLLPYLRGFRYVPVLRVWEHEKIISLETEQEQRLWAQVCWEEDAIASLVYLMETYHVPKQIDKWCPPYVSLSMITSLIHEGYLSAAFGLSRKYIQFQSENKFNNNLLSLLQQLHQDEKRNPEQNGVMKQRTVGFVKEVVFTLQQRQIPLDVIQIILSHFH